MNKTILLIFLGTLSIQSQTISKQLIGPIGGVLKKEAFNLRFSAGEVVVGGMTDDSGELQLGNGYYPSLNLSTLSIETQKLQTQFKVYPNPTSEAIFITHPKEKSFEVSILNINGKQILKKTYQEQNPISLKKLSNGIYLINITSKNSKQTNTYKIIKR